MMRRLYTALLLIAIGVFIVALMEPEESAEGDVSGGAQASQADPPSAGDVYRDLQLGRA